jgi:hypothetical protein
LPFVDYADVQSPSPRMLIPLAEARDALNLPSSTVVHDSEIVGLIYAATLVIENLTGPQLPDTRTEVHEGGEGATLFLYAYPTAITSVTEDGVALSTASGEAYKVGKGGVLYRIGRDWSTASPNNITVTYTVGPTPTVIPPNVLAATREQVRFLYQMGQAGARPNMGSPTGGGTGYMAAGYAVPNRVVELLAGEIGRHQPLGTD